MARAADPTSSVYDLPLTGLDGRPLDGGFHGRAVLVVNVASECGYTPQYTGLQELYERYRDRGLVVLGTPCNQFGGQEPGTAEQIAEFCSTYSVTFPLTEKLAVKGRHRHPLYERLTRIADPDGKAGDVKWNFEKFVVSPDGRPVARFRSATEPDDPRLVAAIEAQLP
ncbi:MAG TPA: glutathione peroxidase [Gaiellales bacterium]|jgi:glutathione peroxidase|nr:glutathione peroxidase [Gaiellales bacterium]